MEALFAAVDRVREHHGVDTVAAQRRTGDTVIGERGHPF